VSWSVTVNGLQDYEKFTLETEEVFASLHPSYPRDARLALQMAKAAGLKSAMLAGGRTPNPYGGDEVVLISISGFPAHSDFLSEMREVIASGPDEGSDVARHYIALARLRERPCSHIFRDIPDSEQNAGHKRCTYCGVCLNGTMLYFEEEPDA
jgi:hypothetical protein